MRKLFQDLTKTSAAGKKTSVTTTNSFSNSVIPYLVDACNQYTEMEFAREFGSERQNLQLWRLSKKRMQKVGLKN